MPVLSSPGLVYLVSLIPSMAIFSLITSCCTFRSFSGSSYIHITFHVKADLHTFRKPKCRWIMKCSVVFNVSFSVESLHPRTMISRFLVMVSLKHDGSYNEVVSLCLSHLYIRTPSVAPTTLLSVWFSTNCSVFKIKNFAWCQFCTTSFRCSMLVLIRPGFLISLHKGLIV